MNDSPEILALRPLLAVCSGHVETLGEALDDMEQRGFIAAGLDSLNKADRRLLDQFAYRYTRLQDDMGARLMPAVLRALGEDVAVMSALDRFNRMEQLGWLPSADEWATLRRIRNEFAHDYPGSPEERFQRLQTAMTAARQLISIMAQINSKIRQRFPENRGFPRGHP
jgi:hypothetical protein